MEGLIDIEIEIAIDVHTNDDDDDDDSSYILSAENGDNWFYFEDQSSGDDDDDDYATKTKQCANTKHSSPPLTIRTRSSTDTTLMHFKYKERPTHTVLHKGRCHFAGLVDVGVESRRSMRVQDRARG